MVPIYIIESAMWLFHSFAQINQYVSLSYMLRLKFYDQGTKIEDELLFYFRDQTC